MQNFIEFYIKYFSCCKRVAFGVWGLTTSFGPTGPERLTKRKSRTLIPIFINKTSLYPKSQGKYECLKYYNKPLPKAMGPKN